MERVDGLDFRVLGPAEVLAGDQVVPLGGSRPLIVLAGLLLRANRLVSVDVLSHWLWGDDQRRSKGALQTYVLRLRRALGDGASIRTERGGYLLEVDENAIDLGRFRQFAARGRSAAERGEHRRAAGYFEEALGQWRGSALQNVESDTLHRDEVGQLAEERTRVRELWAETLLTVGEHDTVVPELERLTRENPLRERPHEQLMYALLRSGRQAEALDVYRRISGLLAEELGLDPGAGLQRAHRLVLGGDAGTRFRTPLEPHIPHQLPADLGAFAGRAADLKALRALLPEALDDGTSTPIASVEGMGGQGKTTLSVHFAHQIADRFTGGQVFLDLRGYGPGAPVPPIAALETMLIALGVPADRIPSGLDERAATWRTYTTGRRLLVVLDNANSTEQVRYLLPGPGCLVVVTSRWQLRGLVATHGARRIALSELDSEEAVELLASAIGVERVHEDPVAAGRFVQYCGGLPLAIRILAVRAAQFPRLPLDEFVTALPSDAGRLSTFDLGDGDETNIRTVFSYSYRVLCPAAARLLRLLALSVGPDLSLGMAVALNGRSEKDTRGALDTLVSAHLLTQPKPGRYQFHDLIRAYATELSEQEDDAAERTAASARLLGWFIASARNAGLAMRPHQLMDEIGPIPSEGALEFSDFHRALAWFIEEHANLLSVIQWSFRIGQYARCWRLAWSLFTYFAGRARVDEWRYVFEIGLRAARNSGERQGEAAILNGLGVIEGVARNYVLAREYLEQALAVQLELGSLPGEARARYNLAMTAQNIEDFPEAYRHGLRSLEITRELGFTSVEANVLRALGDLCAMMGDYPQALSLADEALALVPPDDLPQGRFSLAARARALLGLGRHVEGIECLSEAVDMFFAMDEEYEAADVLSELGTAHLRYGRTAAARDCWLRAVRLLTRLDHPDADRVRAQLAGLVRG
ncbi:DNA-binding SARP family transcriptional activator [Amycolatopsis echigonensis]|uniref:DNA-binding SARP family transcriptional activator n=1 Tax=Amycolatopsis echigonensis TaxID=2576905 RepID=A0A2N3WIM0_9PSEU|nr:BTAD domain-containing putative transcriptional regulator [Amycolatopsis niigatensis]PKV93719.1 DNA-binding SARP family transcriptional activator [Amycolatopsis niigatensis]